MIRRGYVRSAIACATGTLTGCASTASGNDTAIDETSGEETENTKEENTTDGEEATALLPPLPGLIAAEKRANYATNHSLEYNDGMVKVEIILTGQEQPSEYLNTVNEQQGTVLRGTVAVDNLRSLANDSRVRAIRRPAQPQTAK